MRILVDNYSYTFNETLFANLTLTGGILVQRHWQASMTVEGTPSRWGHRSIAVIEAVPLLGGICALVELIAARYFSSIDSPGNRIEKRKLNLIPLTSEEQQQYHSSIATYVNRNEPVKINDLARSCDFNETFKQQGIFKLQRKQGIFRILRKSPHSSTLFDLRKIAENKEMDSTTYAPFQIRDCPDNKIFMTSSEGWLVLQPSPVNHHMSICRIDNFTNMPGIGSALVQFAIEKSIEAGFDGKIFVVSTNASGLFYYKLGFVCNHPMMQKFLETAYRNHEISFDGGPMHLPEDAILAWKKKIAEHPILFT